MKRRRLERAPSAAANGAASTAFANIAEVVPDFSHIGTPAARRHARALWRSGGVVSRAAEMLGVSRTAVATMIERHPELREVRETALERVIDAAENSVFSAAAEGKPWACKMVLLAHPAGRARGWAQSSQVELEARGAIQVVPLPERLTESQWNERYAPAALPAPVNGEHDDAET